MTPTALFHCMWHSSQHHKSQEKEKYWKVTILITWWRKGSNVSLAFATAITQAVLISHKKKKEKGQVEKLKQIFIKAKMLGTHG